MGHRFEVQTKSGEMFRFYESTVDEMYFFNADLLKVKDVPLLEVVGDILCYRRSDDTSTKQCRSALLKEWKAGRSLPEGYIVYEVDKQWFMKYEVLATDADFDSSDDDGSFCYTEMPDDYYPED
jgi:hypothetical protein